MVKIYVKKMKAPEDDRLEKLVSYKNWFSLMSYQPV